MSDVSCKLCQQLGNSIVKEETKSEEVTYKMEMESHVEMHRLQLQLANKSKISKSELFEKCFPTVTDHRIGRNKGGGNQSSKAISAMCRALFADAKRKRKTSVYCFECGSNLNVFGKDNGRIRLINHVMVHLRKPVFECRHCDRRYVCMDTLKRHLKDVHSLSGSDKANFVDSSAIYQQEMLEMFKRCFDSSLAVSDRWSVQRKCRSFQNSRTSPLINFCHHLFAHQKIDSTVQCQVCLRQLRFFFGGSIVTRFVIDHARTHLKIQMFNCRHCDVGKSTKGSIHLHLNQIHNLNSSNANYEDLSCKYVDEIKEMLQRCFQKSAADTVYDETVKHDSNKYALTNLCRELLANRDRKSPTHCLECGSKLRIFSKVGNLQSTVAINHACLHLKKLLFACRHCDNRYSSKFAMTLHLQRIHKLSAIRENFVDSSNDYQREIMDALKHCFELRQGQNSTKFKTQIVHASKQFRSPLPNFCRQLFGNREFGKLVNCLICPKHLNCISKWGSVKADKVIEHACTHLKKLMFNCRRCDFQTTTKANVRSHLKSLHKTKNGLLHYEDFSADYFDEIKAMIEKCFKQSDD